MNLFCENILYFFQTSFQFCTQTLCMEGRGVEAFEFVTEWKFTMIQKEQ